MIKKTVAFLSASFFIALIIMWFYFFAPLEAAIQKNRAAARQLAALLKQKKLLQSQDIVFYSKLQSLQNQYHENRAGALDAERTITDACKALNLELLQVKPETRGGETHISLATKGNLQQLIQMFVELQKSISCFSLDSLVVQPNQARFTLGVCQNKVKLTSLSAWKIPSVLSWRDPFSTKVLLSNPQEKPIHRIIDIHYANAAEIATLFQQKSTNLLSSEGKIQVNPRSNQLWIYDYAKNIQQALKILQSFDQPTPAILIKARIINLDSNYLHALGVIFKQQNNSKQIDNTFTIPIINLHGQEAINVQLQALIKDGHAKLVANPRLMTLNNETALIESGDEIPYQEKTGKGNTSVAFKKAVLRLKVTPRLMPQNKILLKLQINQDTVSALTVNGVPAIRTQQLQTQALIQDHETLILGGIYQQTEASQQEGVPGLQHIPLLGHLFVHHQKNQVSKELLIFITPEVVGH